MTKSLPNIVQKSTKTWPKINPKLTQNWPKIDPKLTKNWLKNIQNWPKDNPKLIKQLTKNRPKSVQKLIKSWPFFTSKTQQIMKTAVFFLINRAVFFFWVKKNGQVWNILHPPDSSFYVQNALMYFWETWQFLNLKLPRISTTTVEQIKKKIFGNLPPSSSRAKCGAPALSAFLLAHWTKFGNIRAHFNLDLKKKFCKIWVIFDIFRNIILTYLDLKWTYNGLKTDLFWTCFGHILDLNKALKWSKLDLKKT